MDNYDRDTEQMMKKINEKGKKVTEQYIAMQNATKMVNPITGVYTPFSNSNGAYEHSAKQVETHKRIATKSIAKAPVKKIQEKKLIQPLKLLI